MNRHTFSILAMLLIILLANQAFAQNSDIFTACKRGDLDDVKQIIEKNPGTVGEKDAKGMTPLHWASHYARLDVMKYLIDHKADVNALNENGESPIFNAILSGKTEGVKLLIDSNADINIRNKTGKTPLGFARFYKKKEADIIQLLKMKRAKY